MTMAKGTWENNNKLKKFKEYTPVEQRDEIAAFQADYDRKWNQPGPKDEEGQRAKLFDRNVERGFKKLEDFANKAKEQLENPFDYIYLMAGSSVAGPEDFDTEMWIVLNGDEDLGHNVVSSLRVYKLDDSGKFFPVYYEPQADDPHEILSTYLSELAYGGSAFTYKELMEDILDAAHVEYQIDVDGASFQNKSDILKLMQDAARLLNRSKDLKATFSAYDTQKREYVAEGDITELRQLYKIDLKNIDITILIKQAKDGLFINDSIVQFFKSYDRFTNRTA